MKCPRCQQDNRAGARFCQECAVPLAPTCHNCGFHLSATAKFCPDCGHSISAANRFRSPEDYTPQHLVVQILTSRSAIEGEHKQVTVLFAYINWSLELLADQDPEDARRVLDPVMAVMMEAVH